MKMAPLTERMRENHRPGIGYHELMRLCFPEDRYPDAFRRSSNGGPPGCAMAFGQALRLLGWRRSFDGDTIEVVE